MTAPATTNGSRHLSNRVFEADRQGHVFSGSRVKNRAYCAAERSIFCPKLHLQASSSAIKEDRALKPWPYSVLYCRQRMPSDQQIVGAFNPHHFETNQH